VKNEKKKKADEKPKSRDKAAGIEFNEDRLFQLMSAYLDV